MQGRRTSGQRPSYEPGDHVCPADLAGPLVCRVIEVLELRGNVAQLLTLEVIDRPGTSLVRTDRQVWRVRPRLLWQTATLAGPQRRMSRFPSAGDPCKNGWRGAQAIAPVGR